MRSTRTGRIDGRHGFSIVELAIALTIASILIGFAVPRVQDAFQQREVNGVRDGVILMAAQARARAMEQAETITFTLDTSNGVATVVDRRAADGTPTVDTVEVLNFAADVGVAADADSAVIRLCYTPRGYATTPCSTRLSGTMDVEFSRGNYEAEIEIWQLGQLRKP